jgi:hypothetical protein
VIKSVGPRSVFLFSLLALVLATPKPAHAYVDPGSGSMLWQLAAATVIGSLFYVRRAFAWVRDRLALRSTRSASEQNADQKQTVESACSR